MPVVNLLPAKYAFTIHYHFSGGLAPGNQNYRSSNPWQQIQTHLETYINGPYTVISVTQVDPSVYQIIFDPNGIVVQTGGYGYVAHQMLSDLLNHFNHLQSFQWVAGDRIDIIYPGLPGMECRMSLA